MTSIFVSAAKIVLFLAASVNSQQDEKDQLNMNRVSNIAQKYSNWALGKSNYQLSPSTNYQITQVQTPPKSYNQAPVKRFFHHVRIQPDPSQPEPLAYQPPDGSYSRNPIELPIYSTTPLPIFTTPYSNHPYHISPSNVTMSSYYFQQLPPPTRLSQLPPQNQQVFRSPVRLQPPREQISVNPNFPRLMETEVPIPTPPMFPTNSSSFPNHMTHSFGPSILSQLLNPILQAPSTTPTPYIQTAPQIHVNPNFPTLSPLPIPLPIQEPTKEEVMKVVSKKRLFGMPRFPMDHHRNFFQSAMTCFSGWCGNECCESRRQFSAPTTTIQATAMPGSPGPPHPLVLVVHPSPPIQQQCSPACQPHCSQQCVARLQYETNFFNHVLEPTCRPDCMPSCHVDCLIIPPQQVRCNSFNCQCLAGYVQCAAFTCCMRYPNLAARMRTNVLTKSSEEVEAQNSDEENVINENRMYTPIRMRAEKRKHDIEHVTPKPKQSFWTKKRIIEGKSTKRPTSTSTTAATQNPCPTTSTTTSTTTTTTPLPPTTTTTTSTTTTTTPVPTTTTTERATTTTAPPTTTREPSTTTTFSTTTTSIPPTTSSTKIVMSLTPIYPDMIMKANKIPMIPAYGMWAIPQTSKSSTDEYDNSLSGTKTGPTEKRNSVGDIRGRHVIRSENFLDVLSELAQVKIKEDITDDFSHAANFIEFMTESIRKL